MATAWVSKVLATSSRPLAVSGRTPVDGSPPLHKPLLLEAIDHTLIDRREPDFQLDSRRYSSQLYGRTGMQLS
jgi:hypothetical protein